MAGRVKSAGAPDLTRKSSSAEVDQHSRETRRKRLLPRIAVMRGNREPALNPGVENIVLRGAGANAVREAKIQARSVWLLKLRRSKVAAIRAARPEITPAGSALLPRKSPVAPCAHAFRKSIATG